MRELFTGNQQTFNILKMTVVPIRMFVLFCWIFNFLDKNKKWPKIEFFTENWLKLGSFTRWTIWRCSFGLNFARGNINTTTIHTSLPTKFTHDIVNPWNTQKVFCKLRWISKFILNRWRSQSIKRILRACLSESVMEISIFITFLKLWSKQATNYKLTI